MRHRRTGRQLVGQARERWRGDPSARRVAHVVAEPAHREDAAAPVAIHAACGVQCQHVEADHIAGLDLPAQDSQRVALCLDVGQLGQAAVGEPPRLVVHEAARHQPRPAVRAGHELQRRVPAHRVHRDPHAAVQRAFDVVVGLVLVPGGRRARARLLGQHVVVVQADAAAAGERAGRGGQPRFEDHAAVGRVVLPVAEVLDETAWIVAAAGHLGARAGRCQVGVDALAQQRHLVGRQQLARAHRAVAAEGRHQVRRDARAQPLVDRRVGLQRASSVLRAAARAASGRSCVAFMA